MNDLTTGNETMSILKFALPMLIGNVFQQLYSTVDSIIVGRVSFPIFPMIITITSLWIVRVPAAAILSKQFGSAGLWMGIPLGWLLGAIVGLAYYKSGKWKKRALINN